MERLWMAAQAAYQLTIIEEEKVPLAPSPGTSDGMVFVLPMLMLLLLEAIYLAKCRGYRTRIRELDGTGNAYCGWRLSKLRETVRELEAEKIEKIF